MPLVHSIHPEVSADGRFIAFESASPALLPLGVDTNARSDVFVRDRDPDGNGVFDEGNERTDRVSLGPGGVEANGHSGRPSISADGRYVAFQSGARNLLGGVTLGNSDVYLVDRDPDANGDFYDVPGALEHVSLTSLGSDEWSAAWDPKVSDDGRFVAFWTAAELVPNAGRAPQVYVRDRVKGWTHLASSDSQGTPGNVGTTQFGQDLDLAGDGSRVAFLSFATNLASGDTDPWPDVYAKDLCPSAARDLGFALPGQGGLEPYFWFCGELASGITGFLRLRDARPGAVAFAAIATQSNPTPLFGGTFVATPWIRLQSLVVGPGGWVEIPVPGGGGPRNLISQWAILDPDAPQGVAFSNALEIEFLP